LQLTEIKYISREFRKSQRRI